MESKKYSWNEIKHLVKKVNLPLFEIIDEISPTESVTLAKYKYGDIISTPKHYYTPSKNGFTKSDAAEYPYFMSIDKSLESYVECHGEVFKGQVYNPGKLFPTSHELSKYPGFNVRPKSMFYVLAGLRSVSIMPIHSKTENYYNLADTVGLPKDLPPSTFSSHQTIIKKCTDHMESSWLASVLIFDSSWKKQIFTNKKWYKLHIYLLEQSIKTNFAKRSSFFLAHILNDINKNLRLKLSAFSIETLQHMLSIVIGDLPGHRPCIDDSGLPLEDFTSVFLELYKPQNTPIVIEPHTYNPSEEALPLYLSLCCNDYNINELKTYRPLKYLSELSKHTKQLLKSLSNHPLAEGTIYQNLMHILSCSFYSSLGNTENVQSSDQIMKDDNRFFQLYNKHKTTCSHGIAKRSLFAKSLISCNMNYNKINS